jgi:hypothetical protein
MKKSARKACINCHFLVKIYEGHSFEIRPQEREAVRRQDYSAFEHYALACHFGVWDEGFNFDKEYRQKIIVETDRRDYCFFWKHRPGMLLPAAEALQKREADNREASRDRRLTLFGLWIAAIALVLDFIADMGPKAVSFLRSLFP